MAAREEAGGGGAPRIGPTRLHLYEGRVPALPILFLWPHARCNCRCVMCDIWKNKSRTEITAAHVEQWMPDWKELGVRSVVLTGGEALMHSHLFRLCDVLRSGGLTVSILSTGITLKAHAAEVVRHTDAVYVSLDGPAEIHNKVRGVLLAYEKMAEGIAAVKAEKGSFPVRARCTVQQYNAGHLRRTVDAARALGADSLAFSPADVTSEAFNRPGGWGEAEASRVALPPEQLVVLEREIDALAEERRADFESGYIIDPPERLRRRVLQYYRALAGAGDFPPNVCNAPWASAVIEYDGTVRPCFFQPAYGNIHEAGGLSATVSSERAIAFRNGLDVAADPICRRCVCTLAIYRCDCAWTRTPPYCDNTCSVVSEFLM
jgi:MoaA/NifB/PqqE/SkfB family radical SAM enzyme